MKFLTNYIRLNGLLSLTLLTATVLAQSPKQVIQSVNQNFSKVMNYKADVEIQVAIPSLKADPVNAQLLYEKPDRFKMKSAAILILPKQSVNYLYSVISDTTAYAALQTGTEKIGLALTKIINIIPNQDTSDLILGKFWIDEKRGVVLKSQLTTKSNGTILIEHTYGNLVTYALPDRLFFTIETQKFKLPKALTLDIKPKSSAPPVDEGKGYITLSFSNYQINRGIAADEFK